MQGTQRKTITTAALFVLLLITLFHFAATIIFGMTLWKALILDTCYLAVVSVPIYAAITKKETKRMRKKQQPNKSLQPTRPAPHSVAGFAI